MSKKRTVEFLHHGHSGNSTFAVQIFHKFFLNNKSPEQPETPPRKEKSTKYSILVYLTFYVK
ncbi:hypothetical protein C6Y45_13755 [Alkalicoccus saliphilus]|uniref:Uncharacterized protein n=1 Tax=Alkalicoccus saliphilus TaxID=200989 RepID=A0A2T4U3L9_9BACI|nr:hypothetical protein C6Y45_13755 [Alkalicoccus saliphilus]